MSNKSQQKQSQQYHKIQNHQDQHQKSMPSSSSALILNSQQNFHKSPQFLAENPVNARGIQQKNSVKAPKSIVYKNKFFNQLPEGNLLNNVKKQELYDVFNQLQNRQSEQINLIEPQQIEQAAEDWKNLFSLKTELKGTGKGSSQNRIGSQKPSSVHDYIQINDQQQKPRQRTDFVKLQVVLNEIYNTQLKFISRANPKSIFEVKELNQMKQTKQIDPVLRKNAQSQNSYSRILLQQENFQRRNSDKMRPRSAVASPENYKPLGSNININKGSEYNKISSFCSDQVSPPQELNLSTSGISKQNVENILKNVRNLSSKSELEQLYPILLVRNNNQSMQYQKSSSQVNFHFPNKDCYPNESSVSEVDMTDYATQHGKVFEQNKIKNKVEKNSRSKDNFNIDLPSPKMQEQSSYIYSEQFTSDRVNKQFLQGSKLEQSDLTDQQDVDKSMQSKEIQDQIIFIMPHKYQTKKDGFTDNKKQIPIKEQVPSFNVESNVQQINSFIPQMNIRKKKDVKQSKKQNTKNQYKNSSSFRDIQISGNQPNNNENLSNVYRIQQTYKIQRKISREKFNSQPELLINGNSQYSKNIKLNSDESLLSDQNKAQLQKQQEKQSNQSKNKNNTSGNSSQLLQSQENASILPWRSNSDIFIQNNIQGFSSKNQAARNNRNYKQPYSSLNKKSLII